jgi:L-fuconolactonase
MTVRFDSHTHAWNEWPYEGPVEPASGEALLEAMAESGIDRALIVCADIDSSRENNGYVAEVVRRNPQRLAYVIDADCSWSPHHHAAGAVSRLERLIEQFPDAVGVTHYVDDADVDDWFVSPEGQAWLELLASTYGVLSLSASAVWAPVVHEIAKEHEDLVILWHHLSGLRVSQRQLFEGVAATAEAPNIVVKLSGLHYLSKHAGGAPWADVWPLLDDFHSVFGAERLCWGSDFPACLRYTSYGASLAAAAAWLERLDESERAAINGGNLEKLLRGAPVGELVADDR